MKLSKTTFAVSMLLSSNISMAANSCDATALASSILNQMTIQASQTILDATKLKAEVAQLKSQKSSLINQLHGLNVKISSANTKSSTLTTKLNSLKQQVRDVNNQLVNLISQLPEPTNTSTEYSYSPIYDVFNGVQNLQNLQMKDIDVVDIDYDGINQRIMFGWTFNKELVNDTGFIGYQTDKLNNIDKDHPISIVFSDETKSRWAPTFHYDKNSEKLYMYYSKSNNHLKGMQIYVTEFDMNDPSQVVLENGYIRELHVYTEERMPLLDLYGNFAGVPLNELGIIDPSVFVDDDGRKYLYYVIAVPGVPGVRPYQEFIRVQKMITFKKTFGQTHDRPIVNGTANDMFDGVAEAQTVVKVNGKYKVILSAYASGWIFSEGVNTTSGQYVMVGDMRCPTCPATNLHPVFGKKGMTTKYNHNNIDFDVPMNDLARYGIGGQTVIKNNDGSFSMYAQVLKDDNQETSPNGAPKAYNIVIEKYNITKAIYR